jgi:hypothetical protein
VQRRANLGAQVPDRVARKGWPEHLLSHIHELGVGPELLHAFGETPCGVRRGPWAAVGSKPMLPACLAWRQRTFGVKEHGNFFEVAFQRDQPCAKAFFAVQALGGVRRGRPVVVDIKNGFSWPSAMAYLGEALGVEIDGDFIHQLGAHAMPCRWFSKGGGAWSRRGSLTK